MARARLVKPGLFSNDELAEVSYAGRLLFIGLWTLADREGRLEDRPRKIKGELFPYDPIDTDAELDALAGHGFIARYEVGGQKLIQVLSFIKHQSPHPREPKSQLPAMGQPPASQLPDMDGNEPEQVLESAETVYGPAVSSVAVAGSSEAVAVEGTPSAKRPPSSKPITLPKTAPTEEWVEEMREKYGGLLRDFRDTLEFHMNGSYYRGCSDKCGFLEKKLIAAVERERGQKPFTATAQPAEYRYTPRMSPFLDEVEA